MAYASPWNFGPLDEDARSVQDVIDLLISDWNGLVSWEKESGELLHEAYLLKLDCSKARQKLGWVPRWSLETAIKKIIEWQCSYQQNKNMQDVGLTQINQYMNS
jgi:CDP-glucose 4,6-dehydratase